MKNFKRLLGLLLVVVMAFSVLAGCAKKEETQYTYNLSTTTMPSNWGAMNNKTTIDALIRDNTISLLYDFAYTDDYSTYQLVPVMAIGDPVDVTDDYVGKYGVKDGETNKVFKIVLNPDACWQDGKKITADDYIYSMKQILDPDFAYSRASNYYQGSFSIYNAKNYAYAGVSRFFQAGDIDGNIFCDENDTLYLDLNNGAFFKYCAEKGYTEEKLAANGYTLVTSDGEDLFAALHEAKDNRIEMTDELWAKIQTTSIYSWWNPYGKHEFCTYYYEYPVLDFAEVGLFKTGEYEITIALDKPLYGFYIKYTLGTSWLIREDIYENSKKQDSTGAWSTSYGTSVDTYMSYGPYMLSDFMDGQQFTLAINNNWFGFKDAYKAQYGEFVREIDGETCEQYQVTKVVYTMVADIATREEMFLKGQIDQFGMNADMLAKYRSSDAIYFTQGESTFYGIICSDYAPLLARENTLNGGSSDGTAAGCKTPFKYNKTILTNKNFRKALCYGLDRTALCSALYPAGTAAIGLSSKAIMADPENGVAYLSLETVKKSLCEFWGVEYGAGKKYETLQQAYDSITGYDIEQAKKLVDIAVDEAIAAGLMTADSIVKLEYCAANASDNETKWYNYFVDAFDKIMQGTKLEGKFEYDSNFTLGNSFGDLIRASACDTAWGFGWSGGTLDPYDLYQVYVDSAVGGAYQYDAWVDWSKTSFTLSLDVDGKGAKEYTYSVADWWQIVNGVDANEAGLPDWAFSKAPDSVRAEVLANIEKNILLNYTTIPLMVEGAVQLKSYKVNWGREVNIFGMNRGGSRYLTFNYSDADWSAYVTEQGGTVNYK